MELRFQAIISPLITGAFEFKQLKNADNATKTIGAIANEKQLILNKIWSELTAIRESHYSSFYTIYPEPNDSIQNVQTIIFERIKNYFPTFDETEYEWKMIHKGQELQNNKSLNDFNMEHGPDIHARIYLFGIGINTHTPNIDVEQSKLSIANLLSQLTTNEKQQMFNNWIFFLFPVLQRSFINFMCYDMDSFYSVYDILLLLLQNGLSQLSDCIDKIHEYFYQLLQDNNLQSLYLKLILIVKSNNGSILSVLTGEQWAFKWVNGAFKDWEMSPDIIRSLLINGYGMIDYVETTSNHLEKNDYIANKFNCYSFIIYNIHNELINDYSEVLQAYIQSKVSIQIIISYVIHLDINNNDIQTINNNFNPQNLYYLNDEQWKTWKQQNNFDIKSQSQKIKTSMRLLVKVQCGKIQGLKGIYPSNTIDAIKLKLFEIEGIPPKQQRLLKGNTILNDTKKVSYYNIQSIEENCHRYRGRYGTPLCDVLTLQIRFNR